MHIPRRRLVFGDETIGIARSDAKIIQVAGGEAWCEALRATIDLDLSDGFACRPSFIAAITRAHTTGFSAVRGEELVARLRRATGDAATSHFRPRAFAKRRLGALHRPLVVGKTSGKRRTSGSDSWEDQREGYADERI